MKTITLSLIMFICVICNNKVDNIKIKENKNIFYNIICYDSLEFDSHITTYDTNNCICCNSFKDKCNVDFTASYFSINCDLAKKAGIKINNM